MIQPKNTKYKLGSIHRAKIVLDQKGKTKTIQIAELENEEEVYYQDQSTGVVDTLAPGEFIPDGGMILAGDLTSLGNIITSLDVINEQTGAVAMSYEYDLTAADPSITSDPTQFNQVDDYENTDDSSDGEDDPPAAEGSDCDGTIGISA